MNSAESQTVFIDPLAVPSAVAIRDAFLDYNTKFSDVTKKAKTCFEQRDWAGSRSDAVARIELYDQCIAEISDKLSDRMADQSSNAYLWQAIRQAYEHLISPLLDRELFKTFFNTLTRRFFKTRGVNAQIEFIALTIEPTDRITHPVARHNYVLSESLSSLFVRVLADYPFAAPYKNAETCAKK